MRSATEYRENANVALHADRFEAASVGGPVIFASKYAANSFFAKPLTCAPLLPTQEQPAHRNRS
jgi:hypothetical protein